MRSTKAHLENASQTHPSPPTLTKSMFRNRIDMCMASLYIYMILKTCTRVLEFAIGARKQTLALACIWVRCSTRTCAQDSDVMAKLQCNWISKMHANGQSHVRRLHRYRGAGQCSFGRRAKVASRCHHSGGGSSSCHCVVRICITTKSRRQHRRRQRAH